MIGFAPGVMTTWSGEYAVPRRRLKSSAMASRSTGSPGAGG